MKIAIIGSGAMGSLYGGYLSAKNEVFLVDIWKEHIETINNYGLTTIEKDNTIKHFKPSAHLSTDRLPIMDVIIIFVKSTNTSDSIKSCSNIIGPETIVVTLQNGYGNDEEIKEVVKAENVISGTTNHGSTILSPGKIFHAGKGVTTIGSGEADSVAVQIIRKMLTESGFEVIVNENVKELILHKLFINTGINALTAILDVPNGEIYSNELLKNIARKLVYEAVEVSSLEGFEFDKEKIFEDVLSVAKATSENTSSMRADVLKKRVTEIDKINGAFVKLAKKHGTEAPFNELIQDLIKYKEGKY